METSPTFVAKNDLPERPCGRQQTLLARNDLPERPCGRQQTLLARNDLYEKKRVKGIEPSSLAWKAIALPLSYTREPPRAGTPERAHPVARSPASNQWLEITGSRSPAGTDWGVQDSNLRRQCHQIYSLTPLTARETPLRSDGCVGMWLSVVSFRDSGFGGARNSDLPDIAAAAAGGSAAHQHDSWRELAAGVEPATC